MEFWILFGMVAVGLLLVLMWQLFNLAVKQRSYKSIMWLFGILFVMFFIILLGAENNVVDAFKVGASVVGLILFGWLLSRVIA